MKIKLAIFIVCVGLIGISQGVWAKPSLFKNEKPIEFVANSGEKTQAVAGHYMVRENRDSPNSRMIRINYVRFTATGNTKGAPIIYLAGGPGGSGIATAKWRRFPLFMALRKYGDVIALDQRGTGASQQPEACTSDVKIPLDTKVNEAVLGAKYHQAANQCLAFWKSQGIDVKAYNTVQNAYDIDDLRVHLQADKVTLWGISYGSHLALAAMKLFPERLDKVIVASVEGLDQTVKLPAMTDKYFSDIQAVIAQQPLKSLVPNLPALIKRVHHKLDNTPIALEVPSKDGSKLTMLFQKQHMRMLASMMIADPNQYLAMLIHIYLGLDRGNTDLLVKVLQRGIFKDDVISFKLMPLVMDVASGISESRLKFINQQAKTSLLGDKLNFPMPMLNRFDASLDLGDTFRAAPKNNIPTLLFTGTLDGRTYPDEQKIAVRGLTNLTQVMVKNAGHNLYTSSKQVLDVMKLFLAGEKVTQSHIDLPTPDLSFNQ
ncbi:alpha/beta hydrolase [Pseudoalteromonas sp. JBTF-M23]|uniref:Proline iminopeptidase n=1 Tax=Pseudoalteromonas caenipelagi TaxID=2726988 RepID=A0A849V9V8_9GAMM|nr:alpha/beta hydrolase [Pseudoalteromonas caenipelagi]NOU50036.1 alpha/beta hydrolase [Pseudoalteromonas caenipelagi]